MRPALLVISLLAVVAATAAPASPRTAQPADSLESAVLTELNAVRAANGLRPLRLNRRLAVAAETHTTEMLAAGYFGHASADGSAFRARVKRFYSPRPRPRRWAVAENLLWHTRSVTARAAVRAWLRSPAHRENILDPVYREAGIAADRAEAAPGIFRKRRVVVLTVDFGRR